jgi:hypothetical protein
MMLGVQQVPAAWSASIPASALYPPRIQLILPFWVFFMKTSYCLLLPREAAVIAVRSIIPQLSD